MLARARRYQPALQALLMNCAEFDLQAPVRAVPEQAPADEAAMAGLLPEEQAFCSWLRERVAEVVWGWGGELYGGKHCLSWMVCLLFALSRPHRNGAKCQQFADSITFWRGTSGFIRQGTFMQYPTVFPSSQAHQLPQCAAARACLVGVGLPRKARRSDLDAGTFYSLESRERSEHDIALGWEDIQHLPAGSKVRKTFEDDTLPGGPYETTIEYAAPLFKPDREEDYRRAWAFFSKQGES